MILKDEWKNCRNKRENCSRHWRHPTQSRLGIEAETYFVFPPRIFQLDYTDETCQKQLVKTFVNSVFVYDDKIVLTFNCSSDDRLIILHEIDAGLQHGVRLPCALSHKKKQAPPLGWNLFFRQSEGNRK